MQKSFNVGGVKMGVPVILGAGVAKHPNQVLPYLHPDAPLGAALSGSYTLEARDGNKGELMWPVDLGGLMQYGFGLNAWGMPNLGLARAMELFPKGPTKPHLVSIAGFKVSDYVEMLKLLKGNKQIAGVELNGGCPNTGHLPVAYMLDDLASLLRGVRSVGFDKPIWLKLSPYMTRRELSKFGRKHPDIDFGGTPTVEEDFVLKLCHVLKGYSSIISAVVMTNTLPNVVFKNSLICVHTDGGFHRKAGLSGPILREHNLTLVREMMATDHLADIDIIGCGGVMTGDDVLAYLQAGCTGVQCTSGPAWSDVKFFQSLLEGSDGLLGHLSN